MLVVTGGGDASSCRDIVGSLGGAVIEDFFDFDRTTHVVLVGEKPKRTLKVLAGLAKGTLCIIHDVGIDVFDRCMDSD